MSSSARAVVAVVVPHGSQSGAAFPQPQPRAKAIARPEREVAARVFKVAVEATGLSLRQLAKRIDRDEALLRRYLEGDRPIPLEVVMLLPPRCEEVVSIALAEHAKSRAIPMAGDR